MYHFTPHCHADFLPEPPLYKALCHYFIHKYSVWYSFESQGVTACNTALSTCASIPSYPSITQYMLKGTQTVRSI